MKSFVRNRPPSMTLENIRDSVQLAFEAMHAIRGNLDGTVKDDTALALGEATGVLMRAKALVARDMKMDRGDESLANHHAGGADLR